MGAGAGTPGLHPARPRPELGSAPLGKELPASHSLDWRSPVLLAGSGRGARRVGADVSADPMWAP